MRYIPIYCVRENMKLGKTLYGKSGEMLLREGTTLNKHYLERIEEIGFNGIYIDDDVSKDIEYVEVISDKLRNKAVQSLKKTFVDVEKASPNIDNDKKELYALAGNIVDEISRNNAMVNMVDLKVFDDYTFHHSVNVAVLSILIGVGIGLKRDELYRLGLGALLHDIGKVFIPKEILLKPGKLTDEEFKTINTHSEKGYRYLKEQFDIPATSYVSVLNHHERYDGKGYPMGKRSDEITLFGRIICLADVYDALTSDRPYRRAILPSEAMEYIMGNSGTMFDPKITLLFTRKIAPYPIGTCVELSNGKVGLVVENYEDCCMRPKIKVIKEDIIPIEPYFLNLRDDKNLRDVVIKQIVNE